MTALSHKARAQLRARLDKSHWQLPALLVQSDPRLQPLKKEQSVLGLKCPSGGNTAAAVHDVAVRLT